MFTSPYMRMALVLLYLVFITILFCLPGSAFPKSNWLSQIAIDKWIHTGIFAVLAWLISWGFSISGTKRLLFIFLFASLYGIGIEVVQDQLIVNREFDVYDWIADMGGSVLGLFVWRKGAKK